MTEVFQGQRSASAELLVEQIEQMLENGDNIGLIRMIQKERPADVAQALDMIEIDQVTTVFKTLLFGDVGTSAEVLIELEPLIISQLYPTLTLQEWAWLFSELSDDDVVAILDLFPDEARDQLLARLRTEDKEDVLALMSFPEGSAGRIMTSEYLALDADETVAAAVEKIRGTRDFDPTNLFYVYVTEREVLVGMVSLRQLLLNKKTDTLRAIMNRDVVTVKAAMDQSEAAEIFRKHDEVTVPVVDDDGKMLGIITVDDVIDVIDEEVEEDIFALIGTSDEELLVGNNIAKIVGLRLPWIMASFCGSLLVSYLMSYAEGNLFQNAAKLFVFVPFVSAMGGNVGVQSATIMARYLSSNQLDWSDAWRSTFKEARVGLMLGLICGLGVGGFAYLMNGLTMMFTVMLAMVCGMTTAATTGTVIPVLMKQLGFDPALATGPFVTSFNDVLATSVYFTIAFNLTR